MKQVIVFAVLWALVLASALVPSSQSESEFVTALERIPLGGFVGLGFNCARAVGLTVGIALGTISACSAFCLSLAWYSLAGVAAAC
jgi:hypothetical protein